MVYLDCNATTPVDPVVQNVVMRFLSEEYGNAGSRTHEFGSVAKRAVNEARRQVAAVVAAEPDEVLFTSGATESNNLALLGLEAYAERSGRKHIVTTEIEHKAVLEPLAEMEQRGFRVTRVRPDASGRVDADELVASICDDTVLVSVMHVNNETGVIQPIGDIASHLRDHPAYLHVDAAQGFGKAIADLRNARIDLLSVSAHKVYGPKGVGALVARRRGYETPPLRPLSFGGGQERGLRPGTLPVPLIAGFGKAAELAVAGASGRDAANRSYRSRFLSAIASLDFVVNGDFEHTVPHTLSVSFRGVDSEAVIVALKGLAAVSNGSACTSSSYEPSHVLTAMGLPTEQIEGAVRFSWCHSTEELDWDELAGRIKALS